MTNEIRVKLAIESESDENKIRISMSPHAEFQLSSIPTTARITADEMTDSDLLIACNKVFSRNLGFTDVWSNYSSSPVPIFVALHRAEIDCLVDMSESVSGCIMLDSNLDLLPHVVRMGRDGYCVLPNGVYDAFIDFQIEHARIGELSLIESAILQELGLGSDGSDIARRLVLSQNTYDRLFQSLLTKLRFTDVNDARAFAIRNRAKLHQRRRSLIWENVTFSKTSMH